MDEPLTMASCHNATLINPGPPALRQLKTERKYIDGNNKKVRQWIYGRTDRNKQNKVILLVGETGAGKTTMINTMINYILGVKFDDQEFYQITEEEEENIDESQSQAHQMTVYEVFVEENPISLTIIDTPGYGHTEGYEKDREISEYLMRLFSDEDGIHDIDAVCFVMKASQNRLSDKELYIFHSVLSLFGKDIEENIMFLLTYSDGGPPTDALNAIKTAEIPCRRDERKRPVHFLFNNQQKQHGAEQYEDAFRTSWEMGEKSMNRFFTLLDEKNRKSVQMTLDVLKERRRLEACVNNLVERISDKESKTEELNQIQEALGQNRDKIGRCENFEFTVKRYFKEKVLIENEWWWNRNATCCSVCQENCHEWGCWWAGDPSKCWVMKNERCTVCTNKCHYSKHVKENKKYVRKKKATTLTFVNMKREYEHTGETSFQKDIFENITKEHKRHMTESQNNIKKEEKVKSELQKFKNEKSKPLHEAYVTVMSLSKITLKSDSAFTLQHLDFLIPRLKEEGKDEWIKNLEDLRKAGEERKNKGALLHVMKLGAASPTHHSQRKSLDEPSEIIARDIRLRDEFLELYERDHLELQQCTERLHCIIEKFEEDYRHSSEASRDAGWLLISGGAALFAGIVAAPFTLGTSLLAATAYVVVKRILALRAARFSSGISSSNEMRKIKQLRQDIEAELKEFQDKVKPMIEKINKIKHAENVIQIEDVIELTTQMSSNMHLAASLAADVGKFNFVLAMISVFKNTNVLKDMNKLAETPIDIEPDESGMTSKAGKFIVEMKKLIHQLQNITIKLQKAKDKIEMY
ncbi:uncharacterized protein LOC113047095 [Carassius auratus]|uniref:Uncharacterized protein LOC113047095 n=1 Tax=Carassius auratus TaxID=7957 RepID=A0A6P6JYI2_CARAU|nr:uncharacterized protein LOC113047095 [Carassius auratus]XP_026064137.1 uncharacterized protein LOC113047095 [Carassius auratus]